MQLKYILLSMRLQQWVKNLFVFAALIFSGHLLILHDFLLTLLGFFAFSLVSSAVYIYNDITDLENDRKHPVKSLRPLPSGKLSPRSTHTAAILLGFSGLLIGYQLSVNFAVILGVYFTLNIFYSLKLKDVVILDVMAIAAGFVLRVAGGAALIQVPMSQWLIICTILLSLFLGFSKRRTELVLLPGGTNPTRSVLGHYSPHFLDQMIGIVTATTVMSYALYTISEETVAKFGTHDLIYTVPFVLYGIFRYLYLVHKKAEGEDPTKTILTDVPLLVNLVLWILVASWIIYRGQG
jgi:4-hydroxybenzoate polyprenyltransferase